LLVLGGVAACNLQNPGLDPPAGVLSYPIGLTLGELVNGKADVLYVVNSNFDLRYNAGSVHAYDLDAIEREVVDHKCERVGVELPDAGAMGGLDSGAVPEASLPEGGSADASVAEAGAAGGDGGLPEPGILDQVTPAPGYETASQYGTLRGILCDGRDPDGEQCCFDGEDDRINSSEFLVKEDGEIVGEILIDSYASSIAIDPKFRRLYVPVRGRDRLVYVDTNAKGALSCGESKERCRRGSDESDDDLDPDASYAAQPRSLTVGKLSDIVPMSMAPADDDAMPMSMPPPGDDTFIVTVHQNGQIALLVDAGKGGPVLHSSLPGFDPLATTASLNTEERLLYTASGAFGSAGIHRYGVVWDDINDRYRLYPSTTIFLSLAGGYDIRDVRFDPEDPTRLFALMRGVVQSVLFVERDPTLAQEGQVVAATRVGEGSSKLTQATLGGRKLLFASCFDARAIFVIDETSRELVSVIRGLAGPFDMVVDTARERMYVADFRANVLRVVDLKGLSDSRLPPPRIIATLGKQRFGGQLK